MRLVIQYTAQARVAAGREEEVLESAALPGSVGELLGLVARRHGAGMRKVLFAGDEPAVAVFVNDSRQISGQGAAGLADGDRVLILAPISGG